MPGTTALVELNHLLAEKGRRIFVAQSPIDLTASEGENCIYVLELPTNALGSAGGRVGGIGERRLQKLHCFRLQNGTWMKIFQIDGENELERFELLYHAAGLAVTLADGTERVVSGVIDEGYVRKYSETL